MELRKFIATTIREYLNENYKPISDFILELKNRYKNEYGIDACDINKSECNNFAEELTSILSKNGYPNTEVLTTDLFIDTATEYSKEDDDEIFYNPLKYGCKLPQKPNCLKV